MRILTLRILALRSASGGLPRLATSVSIEVIVNGASKLFRFFEQMLLIVIRWILLAELIQLLNALLHPSRVFEVLHYLLYLEFYVHSALRWLRHLLYATGLIIGARLATT